MTKLMTQVESAPAESNAFQAWMGQWRLATLDIDGCQFVLRFVMSAFRSRRPQDNFWEFLDQFFSGDDSMMGDEDGLRSTKELLEMAGSLGPEQAGALMSYLCQRYSTLEDRLFWGAVSDAIQLYAVAPGPFGFQNSKTA